MIRWFDSYLKDRSQVTKVSNCLPDPGNLSCGVPQGSIDGPLLFIMYIKSLPDALEGYNTYLYVDDTAILTTGKDIHTIEENLSNALASSARWMNDNKLSLNVSKTKCMYFGKQQHLSGIQSQEILCNGEPVEVVHNFNYLGLVLDPNLKFTAHTEHFQKKIFSKMKGLAKIRQITTLLMSIQL